jgi:hypothetical protein
VSDKFEEALDDYISDVLKRNPGFVVDVLRLSNPRVYKDMIDWWGEPCPDFDDECPVCAAWNTVLNMSDLDGLDVKTVGK